MSKLPYIIKVATASSRDAVAGAIAGLVRDHQHAEIRAVGAHAVTKATEAIVIATDFLAQEGIAIVFVPRFVTFDLDGEDRHAILFVIDLGPQ